MQSIGTDKGLEAAGDLQPLEPEWKRKRTQQAAKAPEHVLSEEVCVATRTLSTSLVHNRCQADRCSPIDIDQNETQPA
eukprot:8313637-Alexandrium_andersonii.AAC.1